jgi:hypothetical protein
MVGQSGKGLRVMADSSAHRGQQPNGPPGVVTQLRPVPRTSAEPSAGHSVSRRLWLLLCFLFLGSSVISLTGLMFVVSWIAAL